jgi:dTDP-4-amino-4,6-dideoxygalactose transaminase
MLDIDSLEKAVTPRTKAIVLVQLFGNRHPQQEQIRDIAQRHGIPIIEDAAQALGVKPAGKIGNLSCISFDPTKIVSAYGTGGAVLTDDEAEYSMLKKLVNHGFENGIPQIAGYNSKISETQAAMLLAQIEKLPQTISRITEVAKRYYSMLDGIEEIAQPQHCPYSNFHKFVIKAEKRDELRIFLKENGIETKIHYPTLLSEQKILDGRKFLKHDLSNAQKVTKKVLSLPIWPSISEAETLYVCECIKRFYALS